MLHSPLHAQKATIFLQLLLRRTRLLAQFQHVIHTSCLEAIRILCRAHPFAEVMPKQKAAKICCVDPFSFLLPLTQRLYGV